jgi:hypothetical protein
MVPPVKMWSMGVYFEIILWELEAACRQRVRDRTAAAMR